MTVWIRGTFGRYSPTRSTLTWVEAGRVVELRGAVDLATLLDAADRLELP
ncbi:MAG: hypothetical protein R2695_12465 [Acidimicrobiales bacterium]